MHPKKLESRIMRDLYQANRDYDLISKGDKILVALSGGKDSYAMLWALQAVAKKTPFKLELFAYHLDQGQPGHVVKPLEDWLIENEKENGTPFEIELQDTYTRVIELTKPGKSYCSLCSRFRRAILYKAATRHGCNKVAIGHHRDDLIETVLLNMFFSGQIKTMPPKLISQDGTQTLIRPLSAVHEEHLAELAELHQFPILPCQLCGSSASQRKFVKGLLSDLSAKFPPLKGNIEHSLTNVCVSHLMDKRLNPLFMDSATDVSNTQANLPVDDENDDPCALPPGVVLDGDSGLSFASSASAASLPILNVNA